MKNLNPYKKFVCLQIPLWLLIRSEICSHAKITYGFLMRHAGENGQCFPGQATLASEMGILRDGISIESASRTVRRYIKELVSHKLILVSQPGLHQTNRYRFLIHPWMEGFVVDKTILSSQEKTTSSAQGQTGLPSIRQKKSNIASLSPASPQEILDLIVMENEGDQQTRKELVEEYGDDNFLAAATEVFMSGRTLYLSNIRKFLKSSKTKKTKTTIAKERHEKIIRTSASSTSGNQSLAKRLLRDRHAKTLAGN